MARSTRRDDDWSAREDAGGRVVLALVLGLALLAGCAYVGAYLAAGDKVPVGTTVAGVDIGGHDPSSAAEVLRAGLQTRADTPFTVVVNGRTQQVKPSSVGLGIDYSASVRKAGAAKSWRPSRLWSYFTDGSTFDPVVSLDQDRLGRLLEKLDVSDGRTPTDGGVVFRRHTFTVRQPKPGLTIDPKSAGTAFWNAYLTDDPSVSLRMAATAPAIDSAAIHRFVRRFANPAMSSPVRLRFGGTTLHLAPRDYGHLLAARREGNTLHPWVQASSLGRLAHTRLRGAATDAPQAATVELRDGRPHVVPARAGVRYRGHDIATALVRAIGSPDRTARVHPTRARASFTSADARKLGIRKPLAQATVRLPRHTAAEVVAAAGRIDGTVLRPGQSLSLRHVLGGATPEGNGGDALATALFNAAWTGGLQVTAHAVGRTYAGDAPLGRDASVADGQDVAFTDQTSYGVLVAVRSTSPRSLTVTLWSTPRWTITSSHGDRTHVVKAGRRVGHARGCTPRAGRKGFDVTVTRTFSRHGHVDHTSSYTAGYAPRAKVVCRAHRRHHHHHRHH